MESLILLQCEICEKEFERLLKEHKRNQKKRRKIYCSLSCAGHGNQNSLGAWKGNGDTSNLVSNNRHDEFTPFRFFIRKAKDRHRKKKSRGWQEVNITLPYLKDLWESQNGKCAISGIQLVQKHWSDGKKNPNQASLDRIDNAKGYIQGNVRFVSYIANICRGDFSDENVIMFARNVIFNLEAEDLPDHKK